MDIEIITSAPNTAEDHADEIWEAIEALGFFVNSLTITPRTEGGN
ncbi:hypothetical protein SEA_BANTAM_153 [Gordonia phage Bantam]|uniref:Uncharacterized protein n=1 Tax=Gordonia phage Bantam TaxID=1887641 RepID=A0A1B3AYN4_9CAUD|nr:hypothetical protein BIZ77_gp026 [Gordonia phage Bantam]AOE43842.1 hypothetical protein SEA_BANTAM_153 [Gordonia phage Bantam]